MVVLKIKFISYIFFSVLFFSNFSLSSQIFDYETEIFLNKLIVDIKSVNKFNKNIKIYIIKDANPNAFVIPKNKLIVSSGLLEQSPDYVSLLAVLAHEVGHLEYLHLEKRKDRLEELLDEFSISHIKKSQAYTLSGGERRRVEIARSLVPNKNFILLNTRKLILN